MEAIKIDANTPAKYLIDKVLEGGWIVKENITKTFDQGGKSFSQTYLVEKSGQVAVLKALDFSIALLDEDPTTALIRLSKALILKKNC